MLPSFRLIAATFLCGFVLVFAGLRLATSLHSMHAAFPVLAAHAAPAPASGASDWPSIPAAAPMLYDLRFVASAAAPMTVSLRPPHIDRSTPVATPVVIDAEAREPVPPTAAPDLEPIKSPDVTAAIPSEASPPVQPTEPQSAPVAQTAPEAATPTEAIAPQAATVATIDPQPSVESAAAAPAAAEPATVPTSDAATVEPFEASKADAAAVEPPPAPKTNTVAIAPSDKPKPDAAVGEPSSPAANDIAALAPVPAPEPAAEPAPATATAAPKPKAATDGGAVEPPDAAMVIAALEPAPAAAETAVPDSLNGIPVSVTVVLPKLRPAGAVLQAAKKKSSSRARRTVATDPFRYNPFGGGFDNWRYQRR